MKTNIRNAAWVIGVLLLAGFCWVGCDRRLDVRTVYPFRVTTMPIPKTLAPGYFTLYYHSLSTERQSLEVVIEDNHGQSQTLAFDFNSKEKDADSDYSLLSHPSRPLTGAAGSKASQ